MDNNISIHSEGIEKLWGNSNQYTNYQPSVLNLFKVNIYPEMGDFVLGENGVPTGDKYNYTPNNTNKDYKTVLPITEAASFPYEITNLETDSKLIKYYTSNIQMHGNKNPWITNFSDITSNVQIPEKAEVGLNITEPNENEQDTDLITFDKSAMGSKALQLDTKGVNTEFLINSISFSEDTIKLVFDKILRRSFSPDISLGNTCTISWRETQNRAISEYHSDWVKLFYNKKSGSYISYDVTCGLESEKNFKVLDYNTYFNFRNNNYSNSDNSKNIIKESERDIIMKKHIREMIALLYRRIKIETPWYTITLKQVSPNMGDLQHSYSYTNNQIENFNISYNYANYEITPIISKG